MSDCPRTFSRPRHDVCRSRLSRSQFTLHSKLPLALTRNRVVAQAQWSFIEVLRYEQHPEVEAAVCVELEVAPESHRSKRRTQ